MTANAHWGFNEAARAAGAQATVLKTGSSEELVSTLRTVAGGGAASTGGIRSGRPVTRR